MEERSTTTETQMKEPTTLSKTTQRKSFKQALTTTKNNEKAFDNDLDRLFTDDEFLTDEEDNGAESEGEQEYGSTTTIPKIKLPCRLITSIRKPWKDCLIVRLLKNSKVGHRKKYCNLKGATTPTPPPVRHGGSNSTEDSPEQHTTASTIGPKDNSTHQEEADFGPWMLVNRRTRKYMGNSRNARPHTHSRPCNRFGPLANKQNMNGPIDKQKGKELQGAHTTITHKTLSDVAHKNLTQGVGPSNSKLSISEVNPPNTITITATPHPTQEISAPVVDSNDIVTGHIISTTIGGKNGEPKQLHRKEAVVECKFDGDRIQIHKNGKDIHFFSRNFLDHP
ncbi:DNA ligase 4 [Camellia lanceoleosa]|uniref:DNA ligase 4 n=1 Tax=Camellia lanceoleosa TaxID=1840588 RepID=A0ACC0GL75_9ERIC|nr:DNA ligase 4 [Camellia lanceoleosa]